MRKKQLFTVNYAVTDYKAATEVIIQKANERKSFGVSALAVHGLMESVKDEAFKQDLHKLDMIVPDGQPVKWALNSFHQSGLNDRVAGPILTRHVLEEANKQGLRVYLYGSTATTLEKLQDFLKKKYPNVVVCGIHVDRFRDATPEEDAADIEKINASQPHIVLVGRGCPRQEKWVASHMGKIHAPMMAVGAAFDFFAGNIKHAPKWMQDYYLEWFYRLLQDPKRLWKRYLKTNSHFIYLVILCKLGLRNVQF